MPRYRGSRKVPHVKIKSVPDQKELNSNNNKKRKPNHETDSETEPDNDDHELGQDEDDEEEEYGSTSQLPPLHDCILCPTGFTNSEKAELRTKAKSMGAEWSEALSSDVTHLISDDVSSAKYKAAIEHGIPVQLSSWIKQLHNLWIGAEKFDFYKITRELRTPPLKNCHVACLLHTELDFIKSRELITLLGAHYTTSAQDPSCTHVVIGNQNKLSSSKSSSTGQFSSIDAIQQFANSEAVKRSINVVWHTWLSNCKYTWTHIPESKYVWTMNGKKPPEPSDPSSPSKEKTKQSQTDSNRQEQTLSLSLSQSQSQSQINPNASLTRPLKKRVKSTDALSPFGFDLPSSSSSRPLASRSNSKEGLGNLFKRDTAPPSLSSLHRKASFVSSSEISTTKDLSTTSTTTSSNSNNGTSRSFRICSPGIITSNGENKTITPNNQGLFLNMKFMTRGMPENRRTKLASALAQQGGKLVDEYEDNVWTIAPFINHDDISFPSSDNDTLVSEWWIEKCLFEDKLVDPKSTFAGKPIKIIKLQHPSYYKFCISGLDPCYERFVIRLCRHLQIDTNSTLRKGETTHVIAPNSDTPDDYSNLGQRARQAIKWGIPIVNLDWMIKLATGSIEEHTETETETHDEQNQGQNKNQGGDDDLLEELLNSQENVISDSKVYRQRRRLSRTPSANGNPFGSGDNANANGTSFESFISHSNDNSLWSLENEEQQNTERDKVDGNDHDQNNNQDGSERKVWYNDLAAESARKRLVERIEKERRQQQMKNAVDFALSPKKKNPV